MCQPIYIHIHAYWTTYTQRERAHTARYAYTRPSLALSHASVVAVARRVYVSVLLVCRLLYIFFVSLFIRIIVCICVQSTNNNKNNSSDDSKEKEEGKKVKFLCINSELWRCFLCIHRVYYTHFWGVLSACKYYLILESRRTFSFVQFSKAIFAAISSAKNIKPEKVERNAPKSI